MLKMDDTYSCYCSIVSQEVKLRVGQGVPEFICPSRGAELNSGGVYCNSQQSLCEVFSRLVKTRHSLLDTLKDNQII